MTGAERIIDFLSSAGVERIYGIPTPETLAVWDALAEAKIEGIVPATELGAAFMAMGEAMTTSRPGVILLGPGPGLTHALSGIAEAHHDGVPLLAIVACLRTDIRYRFRAHEIDHAGIARPAVKATLTVTAVAELPGALSDAWHVARHGEPGSVVLPVPSNVLEQASEGGTNAPPAAPDPVRDPSHAKKVAEASALIGRASKVAIYAGAGAIGAADELRSLAERLQAPVATTASGRGVIPDDHPLAVGYGYGLSGPGWVRRLFRERDLVLAVGVRFSEVATGGYSLPAPRKLIHVDANPAHLGVNLRGDLEVASDARAFLGDLLPRVPKLPTDEAVQRRIERSKRKAHAAMTRELSEEHVEPETFFQRLRSRLGRDAVLALDTGRHAYFGLHAFGAYGPRTLLFPVDYGAAGFALPAAIGAKLARPERHVAAACGDGSFLVTGLELRSAAERGLGVPLFVLAEKAERKPLGRGGQSLDYRAFAQAVGARTVKVENDFDLDRGLDAALAPADRPTLCQVAVRYERLSPYVRGALAVERGRRPDGSRVRRAARAFARRLRPGR